MSDAHLKHRVLVVDDNRAIHDDIRRILASSSERHSAFDSMKADLFGNDNDAAPASYADFEVDSAFQGQDALRLLRLAMADEAPYALAFVDARMPPGWNGLQTISHLWREDPHVQVILCTAYSDHTWTDVRRLMGDGSGLVVLKKPFDNIEVVQLAHALTKKWQNEQLTHEAISNLETTLDLQVAELDSTKSKLSGTEIELVQKNRDALLRQRDQQRLETELNSTHRLKTVGELAGSAMRDVASATQNASKQIHALQVDFNALLVSESVALELKERIVDGLSNALASLGTAQHTCLALRKFSMPDQPMALEADINDSIDTTLLAAVGEYDYVADIVTDFDNLPPVRCFVGQLRQVWAQLVLNAAHAIAEGGADDGARGLIEVITRHEGDEVVITFRDNGCGIPDAVAPSIFDAYFTTKQIRRCSGHGLSIARAIVVDRHGGSLTLEKKALKTTDGSGATFQVRLPITGLAERSSTGS